IPVMKGAYRKELHARLVGLGSYLDLNNSGAPEGTFTSTLPGYDGTVAPPIGPGGTKFYDDNDWVGIELMRIYKLTHSRAVLGAAEGILAFEMAGWQADPQLACPGGIPFSNDLENTDRNTVSTAPAAELALQLYLVTKKAEYLRFAEMAYAWVRRCLLQPGGLYSDHIRRGGAIDRTVWSYNQGTMMGAGALLCREPVLPLGVLSQPPVPGFGHARPAGTAHRAGIRRLRLGEPAPRHRPVRGRIACLGPAARTGGDRA